MYGLWLLPSLYPNFAFFVVSQGLPGPPGEKGDVGDVGSMVWTMEGMWRVWYGKGGH